MKNTYLIIILLCSILSPVFAELSVSDLEKIDEKIGKSNDNLKGHVDNRFDSVEKQLDRILSFILGLLAGVIVISLTPIGFIWWYVKRGESFLSELMHSAKKSLDISKKSLDISKIIETEDREYANDMKKYTENVIETYKELEKELENLAKTIKELEGIKELYLENFERVQESQT